MDSHNEDVISEFTKQASTSHNIFSHSNDYSLNLMIRFSEPTPYDTVLDVTCGNGTVAFEYAKLAKHVTGIDITPSMIERARIIQNERHLDNMDWKIRDISTLPFKDNFFSIVVTRGSLHHLIDSNKVIEEMYRVCQPGGKILVTDITVDENKQYDFNSIDKVKVFSYTKALTLEDIREKKKSLWAINIRSEQFDSKRNLKMSLSSSNIKSERLNKNIPLKPDLDINNIGRKSQAVDDHVHHHLPISTVMGIKEK